MSACSPKVILISQVYPPDAVAVGQHFHDVNSELVKRGYRVLVYTSNRGYNDPTVRFPARETMDGVDIVRLPLSSFGKKFLPLRIVAALSFMIQVIVRCLLTSQFEQLIVSTSPPMCVVAAIVIDLFRRTKITFWAMDLNPDQLICHGKLSPNSWAARTMDALNRRILRRAKNVVALDKFMAQRLCDKLDVHDKLHVVPPWPANSGTYDISHEHNPFRKKHHLADRRVIMYSGNHGSGLPLDTLLQAAHRFKDDPRVTFMFIGGGVRKADVEQMMAEHKPNNVFALPYQPLPDVPYSLSAADVHVVSVGEQMTGIIHPCKIYGAMSVGRPILLLGPIPNYASDLVADNRIGWLVRHGDLETMASVIREIIECDPATLKEMGDRSRRVIQQGLSQEQLVRRFCDVIGARSQGHELGKAG